MACESPVSTSIYMDMLARIAREPPRPAARPAETAKPGPAPLELPCCEDEEADELLDEAAVLAALLDSVARELEVAATLEAVLVPLSKVKVALLAPVVKGPMALAVAVAAFDTVPVPEPEPEAGATSVIEAQAVPDVVIRDVGTAVPELWPLNVEVMTH